MGAFMGMNTVLALLLMVKFAVTENTFGYFFTYVAVIGVVVRAFVLGKLVAWLKEPRLSRIGMVLLAVGLFTMPLAPLGARGSRSAWRSCRSAPRSLSPA